MKQFKPILKMKFLFLGIFFSGISVIAVNTGCGNLRVQSCADTQECTRQEICSRGNCVPISSGDGGTQKDEGIAKSEEKNAPDTPNQNGPTCNSGEKKCNGASEAIVCKNERWTTIRCASDEECKSGVCGKAPKCRNGETRSCGTNDQGECRKGTQTCELGVWGNCLGEIKSTPEICDGLDNDCNGQTDEGSSLCPSGQECRNAKCESTQTINKPRIFVKSDGSICTEMSSSDRPKAVFVGSCSISPAPKNPVLFTVSLGSNIFCTPPKSVQKSCLIYFLWDSNSLWPHKTGSCTNDWQKGENLWCKGHDLIWGFVPEGAAILEGLETYQRDNQFRVTL